MRYILSIGDYSAVRNLFVVTPPDKWIPSRQLQSAYREIQEMPLYSDAEKMCAWARVLVEMGFTIEIVGGINISDDDNGRVRTWPKKE